MKYKMLIVYAYDRREPAFRDVTVGFNSRRFPRKSHWPSGRIELAEVIGIWRRTI